MMDKTHDDRPFRTLNIIDEFSRESFAIKVKQNLKLVDVLDCLTEFVPKESPIIFVQITDQNLMPDRYGNVCMNEV